MSESTLTATFDHFSDADASRAVLELSIPGIAVDLRSDATTPGEAAEPGAGPWRLTATVPDGMRGSAQHLLHQTAPAAGG